MKEKDNQVKPREATTFIAWLKFFPVFALAILIIVFKLDLMVAAALACIVAGATVMYVNRSKVDDVVNIMVEAAGKITVVYLILMMAYCVAESFMATGVGASIINLSLRFGISGQSVAPVGFLVTCVLSVATGSSWGSFAACAPVFLWLNYIVGGDIVLTACAIAGGSCFGDNIGLISDTTVVSSGLNDVNVVDRVRHQGIWSLMCVAVSAVIFFLLSLDNPSLTGDPVAAINAIPPEAWAALEIERPSAILLLNQVRDGV
ncbi:MAG: Na+/H+ antiporter NhaC family protein, partial [Oscillospiraceae bacterium]